MNEDDLRDCFAMFALLGVRSSTTANYEEQAKWCYEMADAMIEARKPKEEAGLPAIRRRVKKGE